MSPSQTLALLAPLQLQVALTARPLLLSIQVATMNSSSAAQIQRISIDCGTDCSPARICGAHTADPQILHNRCGLRYRRHRAVTLNPDSLAAVPVAYQQVLVAILVPATITSSHASATAPARQPSHSRPSAAQQTRQSAALPTGRCASKG